VSAFFDILTGYFLINPSSSSSKEYLMRIALKIATIYWMENKSSQLGKKVNVD